jgi:hypothetical protein
MATNQVYRMNGPQPPPRNLGIVQQNVNTQAQRAATDARNLGLGVANDARATGTQVANDVRADVQGRVNDVRATGNQAINDARNLAEQTARQELDNARNELEGMAEEGMRFIKDEFIGELMHITESMQKYLLASVIVSIVFLVIYMFDGIGKPFLFLSLVINTIVVGVVLVKNYYRLGKLPLSITLKIKEVRANGINSVTSFRDRLAQGPDKFSEIGFAAIKDIQNTAIRTPGMGAGNYRPRRNAPPPGMNNAGFGFSGSFGSVNGRPIAPFSARAMTGPNTSNLQNVIFSQMQNRR